jgi:hypothetical protein
LQPLGQTGLQFAQRFAVGHQYPPGRPQGTDAPSGGRERSELGGVFIVNQRP